MVVWFWMAFTRNPVSVAIQPVRIGRISPQDRLRIGLASKILAVVAVALANVLRGIKGAACGGWRTRLAVVAGAFSHHAPLPRRHLAWFSVRGLRIVPEPMLFRGKVYPCFGMASDPLDSLILWRGPWHNIVISEHERP